MSVEQVYEYLLEAGSPVTFSSLWQELPCDPSFFRLPPDTASLLESLQSKFEVADLAASGAMLFDDQIAGRLNPLLSAADGIIWALREKPQAPPFQLVANLASIHPKKWSFRSTFFDCRTAALIEAACDQVAVAFSMTDLAILSSLKIPTVPADKLSRLSGKGLQMFSEALYLEGRATGHFTEAALPMGAPSQFVGQPRSLKLFAWSVKSLSQGDSSAAEKVWEHLGDLQEYLGLPFDEFQLWKPTVAELTRLSFIADLNLWEDLRNFLLEGPDDHSQSLLIAKKQRLPPDSLAEAVHKWGQTQSQKSDQASRQAAWKNVQAAHEQQLYGPLLDQAVRTTDPTERNLVTMLASMSRLLHPQLLTMAETIGRQIGERGASVQSLVPKDEFLQVMAMADRVMALTQGIQACRQKKLFQPGAVCRPRTIKFAGPKSASPPRKSPQSGGKDS